MKYCNFLMTMLVLGLMGCTNASPSSSTGYLSLETGEECVPDGTYKAKGNNGHGNNIDGVDVSNPGKSKEGLDTDPTVDDEKKTHKGKGKHHQAAPAGCDQEGCCDEDMFPGDDDDDDDAPVPDKEPTESPVL
ncbi:MAG: hypothetical protein KC416_03720 [Myxococcales bacterium]|nr:hypothetical protein [Myxococcales bacterium]